MLVKQPKIDLFIAAYILQAAGLGPLLLSTLGFLGLAIAGGLLGTHISPEKGDVGLILRRASASVFAGVYVILFLAHFGCWTYHFQMRSYRRKLLAGMTLALPFLGVRAAYAILAAWSSSDLLGGKPSSNPILAKFNPITGQWVAYLAMSLVMEFIVAILYLLFSTVLSRRRHHH
ncbi:hypothetical protein H0H81_012715 [Sphagnurus paluster]|uniref:DUF7702 domain-containing protein n=1 Tax=Sphagnurus paluster TaxID=117069 RepID=A0A9P7KM70_9AGAR|nr:hypothetical protein H0H81_012715 [Sphagnurus paluster]